MADLKVFLFTDLDGTLLDYHTYRPGPAAAALRRIFSAGVGVVFTSSKTLAEQRHLADSLGLEPGFIAENGAQVELPAGFGGDMEMTGIRLGLDYQHIRRELAATASEVGARVRGFGDMTTEEVAAATGLPVEQAALAKRRCCTETLVDTSHDIAGPLSEGLLRRGLLLQQGTRFWSVQGRHDKGEAVRWVLEHARNSGGECLSFGFGDGPNDQHLLEAVDRGVLVRRPDLTWVDLRLPGLIRVEGVGPAGWIQAADLLLKQVGAS